MKRVDILIKDHKLVFFFLFPGKLGRLTIRKFGDQEKDEKNIL